jgi:hypothetical protein
MELLSAPFPAFIPAFFHWEEYLLHCILVECCCCLICILGYLGDLWVCCIFCLCF